MSRRSSAPFSERLALARGLVTRGPVGLPPHVVDQIDAASRDVWALHNCLMTVLPALEPTRHWRRRADTDPSDDTRTLLLAALLGCTDICVHLRRGGPRPAFARLPLGRVDCDRCSATSYRPVTAADQCDVCTATGVEVFWPFVVQHGPVMLGGDACEACAEAMGIRLSEAAS